MRLCHHHLAVSEEIYSDKTNSAINKLTQSIAKSNLLHMKLQVQVQFSGIVFSSLTPGASGRCYQAKLQLRERVAEKGYLANVNGTVDMTRNMINYWSR